MAKKFIDEQGLRTLWNQSKDKFVSKESLELKKYNLNMNGADWITLAKVTDVSLNSSALFSINCYGVKDQNRIILTTSVFNISVGLDEDKNIISSVLPISQTPEIQLSGDSGSSSVGSGGSGNGAVYGLSNIAFEKHDENTIYVMGLISFPATDQYDNLDVEMRLDDNLNFEYLESLDVVYKQEDDTLQEGTQIYVKGDYVNYYMRDRLVLIQQYINSVGTYDSERHAHVLYKREDGNVGNYTLMYKTAHVTKVEYYVCGITSMITEYYGLVKDYEKFRNEATISIPIQLGVEFNLFNILKEHIDKEVTDDLGKGYKVELYQYYNPGGVSMDYNGLGDDYTFVIHTVGTSEFDNVDESNSKLRNCDKNTPNYVIRAYDSLGEYLEEGTIYLKVRMVPDFFIIDFIFNCPNQFKNGQKLEITEVSALPLRYMGDTKVENYSQSYELYNPYSRLDMLADGDVVNRLDMSSFENDDCFTISTNYEGFINGKFLHTGKSVNVPKQIIDIGSLSIPDERSYLTNITKALKDYFTYDYLKDAYNSYKSLPIFWARSGTLDTTGGTGCSFIVPVGSVGFSIPDTSIVRYAVDILVYSYVSDKNYSYVTKGTFYAKNIYDDDNDSYTEKYSTSFRGRFYDYPLIFTKDANGDVIGFSINGTDIALKDYTDATFVPISSSSTDSTVGDSTLSNTNGEILINTNKSGYKVETKSSGANLTVEAGPTTGTSTTTVKVNPGGVTINDEKVATEPYVEETVANLVNAAPEALDTLKELSTALGDDPNFATTVANQIGSKVPIEKYSTEHQATFSTIENNGDNIKLMSRFGATDCNLNISWQNGVTVNGSKIATDNNVVHMTGNDFGITGNKSWEGAQYYNGAEHHDGNNVFNGTFTSNVPIKNNKYIRDGFIDLHPESSHVTFPYYNSAIAYLVKKGGSFTITGAKTSTNAERIFDGTPSYSDFTVENLTDTVTILIKTHKYFDWWSTVGISFGSGYWCAKSIKTELGYAATIGGDPAADAWVTIGDVSDNSDGTYLIKQVKGPLITGDAGTWNTIRITLSNFNASEKQFRIAGIFAYTGTTGGLETTLMTKKGGEMYGNLMPYKDKGTALGYADKRFKDIYGETGHFNAIVPYGNDTGSIGNSASKWWAIRAHYINGDALQENGINIRNIFSERSKLLLGRNSDTVTTNCCSFFTMTFDKPWNRSYFTLDIKDIESAQIEARYVITFNVQDTVDKVGCNIRQVYGHVKEKIKIFAVQNNNQLTFYLKLIDTSYCHPILYMRDFNIIGGSYEFKAGTWTTEIPEATFTEVNILDIRYDNKYLALTGGILSGDLRINAASWHANIRPTTSGGGSVGSAANPFYSMYANYFYENGIKLEDKYLQKDNTQSFNIRASSNSDYKTVSFDYDLGLNVEGNITTENTITSGWLSTDSLEIYNAEDTGGTPERITTIDAEGLVGYREFDDFKNDLGINKWWRSNYGIRSSNGNSKTFTYTSAGLYAMDTGGTVMSSTNLPKVGDYIFDPYGSVWVINAVTSTTCTAIQRWMSTVSWEVCLEEGTLITMADGTQKPIEEVQIGDSIMGYDFEKDKPTEAIAMFANQAQRDEKTTYVLFSNGEVLSMTDRHTLYSKTHGRYIAINDMKEGDIVLGKDGEDVEILAIHWNMYEFGHKQFYHITSSNNTYFANNILNAEHPVDRYNWIVNRMNLELPEELLEIIKEDSKEYDCMKFTTNNKDFVKKGLQHQYLIKKTTNDIDALKRYLMDTDYVALKYAEGREVDTSIIEKRQENRNKINELQSKLEKFQTEYNQMLVEYSDLGIDILLSDNERRVKYFKLACKNDNTKLNIFKKYYKGE